MAHQVYYTSSLVFYHTKKDTLLLTDDWDSGGDATMVVRAPTTMASTLPVRVACNTTSSLTFGGSVRGWTVQLAKASATPRYDLDCDDWRPYLDRQRFARQYTSIAIDSIARNIVDGHTSSFASTGIHSMLNEAGSLTWPVTNFSVLHNLTVSQALDSLVTLAGTLANDNPADPPVWGVGMDRVVTMVGAGSSYGTTVVIDDADLNLRGISMTMVGNTPVTRVWAWGASTTAVTSLAASGTSLRVPNQEYFWGPSSLMAKGATAYVAYGAELIPIISVDTVSGDNTFEVSSLNYDGVAHGGIPFPAAVIRAVVRYDMAPAILNNIGSLTGEPGYYEAYHDTLVESWSSTNPIGISSLAIGYAQYPSAEPAAVQVLTVNSQVMAGGWLAVSLTATGLVPGLYQIQRVTVRGFERGDAAPPVYQVDAGLPRYRVDSLL